LNAHKQQDLNTTMETNASLASTGGTAITPNPALQAGVITPAISAPAATDLNTNTNIPNTTTPDVIELPLTATAQTATKLTKYVVDLHPMPTNESPFVETPPTKADMQVYLAPTQLPPVPENALQTLLPLPGHAAEDPTEADAEIYPMTIRSVTLPGITVILEALKGETTTSPEPPVIASPHPSATTSYMHHVLARQRPGALDLRAELHGYYKGKHEEVHTLGRVWHPLANGIINWNYGTANYDAAELKLAPAFEQLLSVRLMSPKDMQLIAGALNFTDQPDRSSGTKVINALTRVQRLKCRFSRLYWRLWTLYYEALSHEENNHVLTVEGIEDAHMPIPLVNAVTFELAANALDGGLQPFFITEHMFDQLPGVPIVQLMRLALSTRFRGPLNYAVTKHWPSLGNVQIYVRAEDSHIGLTPMTQVHSGHIHYILQYYAAYLGQHQLIDEIGRTVSAFLYRPEGDSLWLGHNQIQLALPQFACAQSLFLAWALQPTPAPYEAARPSYYKGIWTGVVHYLMCALATQTALTEHHAATRVQLAIHAGIDIDRAWSQNLERLTAGRGHGPLLNQMAQQAALRFGWGQPFNRILYSLALPQFNLDIFGPHCHIPQWSEWFLFERKVHEGTALCAILGKLRPTHTLRTNMRYTPSISQYRNGVADVYYRLAMQDAGAINFTRHGGRYGHRMTYHVPHIRAYNDLPADGQFRELRTTPNEIATWSFSLEDSQDLTDINYAWERRTGFTWELHTVLGGARMSDDQWLDDPNQGAVHWNGASLKHAQRVLAPEHTRRDKSHNKPIMVGHRDTQPMKTAIEPVVPAAQSRSTMPEYSTAVGADTTPARAKVLARDHAKEKNKQQHKDALPAVITPASKFDIAWKQFEQWESDAPNPWCKTSTAAALQNAGHPHTHYTTPEADRASQERMRQALNMLGRSDLEATLIGMPFKDRGEWCRCLEQMLRALSHLVPSTGDPNAIYRGLLIDLPLYAEGLAQVPALTPDECAEAGLAIAPKPGEMLGWMRAGMTVDQLIMYAFTGDTEGIPEKVIAAAALYAENIEQRIDQQATAIPAQDFHSDPSSSSTPYKTGSPIQPITEMSQTAGLGTTAHAATTPPPAVDTIAQYTPLLEDQEQIPQPSSPTSTASSISYHEAQSPPPPTTSSSTKKPKKGKKAKSAHPKQQQQLKTTEQELEESAAPFAADP
jgi:hypothetical protein